MFFAKITRKSDDERDLQKLDGLEFKRPHHDPAPGIADDGTGKKCGEYQEKRQGVEPDDNRALVQNRAQVNITEKQHESDPRGDKKDLQPEKMHRDGGKHEEGGENQDTDREK